MSWRVGEQVPINVYDGDRPVCQCHNESDAILIVQAVNLVRWLQRTAPETLKTWRETYQRERES
jgi:hypothetical protein